MGRPIAVATLALVAVLLVLAVNLLPSTSQANEKGTFAPLVLTWMMIGATLLSGVALAGFLFTGKKDR
jgi:uncharacterized membrane protein YiaA